MAFIQKISSGNTIDIDAKVVYVTDLTGNIGDTTHKENPDDPDTYTAIVNTTGYGAPNPLRSDLALFLVAYIKKTTGNVFLSVKANNPTTVDKFEVSTTEDGWYNFDLISVPAVLTPVFEDYVVGKLIYDKSIGKLVERTEEAFVPVADLTKYIDGVYSVTSSDKLVVSNHSRIKQQTNLKKADLYLLGGADTRGIRNYQELYDQLHGLIEAAIYNYCRGDKMVAQAIVEFMNKNLLNCLC